MSKIKYPKIAGDLKPIIAVLVQSGFLQDGRSIILWDICIKFIHELKLRSVKLYDVEFTFL